MNQSKRFLTASIFICGGILYYPSRECDAMRIRSFTYYLEIGVAKAISNCLIMSVIFAPLYAYT